MKNNKSTFGREMVIFALLLYGYSGENGIVRIKEAKREMLQKIKTFILPLAMLTGFLFSDFFARLAPITPYLIFTMLFVTFCRITPKEMHFRPLHFWLLLIQIGGSILVYVALRLFMDEITAQGVMIAILAPTATSAVVIAGMLGANIASMATFTLLSNLAVAVTAPVIFSLVGSNAAMPFIDSFLLIIVRVLPLLVTPFVIAFLLLKLTPKVHKAISKMQMVSFYLWAISLVIVTGQMVSYVSEQNLSSYTQVVVMALLTLVACLGQFAIGRWLGRKYDDTVAGGQSLGQKNTILAIWMAQTYLNPIASIAPASYVLWQNMVNSWQLWRERKNRPEER